ncbi:hypothetical protein M3Y99_00743400 [Aphelenchoides fujianensis]|nr:hypothetical protein M3Y99_00743400 [Aphelenchoides fujianensis]
MATLGESSPVYRLYQRTTPYLQIGAALVVEGGVLLIVVQSETAYEEIRVKLEYRSPVLRTLFQTESSLFCLATDESGKTIKAVGAALIAIFAMSCLIFVLVYSAITLQRRRGAFHAKTYHMQAMLLKSCAAQIFGSLATMGLPFMFCVVIVLFRINRFNHWFLVALSVSSAHSTIDFVIMVVSIRPYRDFLFGRFWKTRVQEFRPKRLFSSVHVVSVARS